MTFEIAGARDTAGTKPAYEARYCDDRLLLLGRESGALFQLDGRALRSETCAEDCARYVRPLLVDEAGHRVFLAHARDSGTNVPISLLTLDLVTCATSPILETFGSGLGEAALSPNGRYLAFGLGQHKSACDASSGPNVVDLETNRTIRLPALPSPSAPEGPENVIRLRWLDESLLEIQSTILRNPIGNNWVPEDCDEHAPRRRTTQRFDVAGARWVPTP